LQAKFATNKSYLSNYNNKNYALSGINVLSLCDGMSCGHIAFDKAGIKVNKYYASEIKKIGIKVTLDNYPDTIELGDVNKVSYQDGILRSENGDFKTDIDIVIFGSPCQSFSIATKTNLRVGLENKKKSGLFLECYRVLKEVNPKYFLMENVASMKNEDKDYISRLLGAEPIMIDSATISVASRKRYYWTNIPGVKQPEKRNCVLQDILEYGYTNREKGHCLTVAESRQLQTPVKRFHRYYKKGFNNLVFKSEEHYKQCRDYYNKHYKGLRAEDIPIHDTNIFDGVRYLTQTEYERLQCVPENYTKCLSYKEAINVLGDGWTIDVITHIFRNL